MSLPRRAPRGQHPSSPSRRLFLACPALLFGMRVVQRGSSDLLVLYLVGSHLDPILRGALPGVTIVAFDNAVGMSPREVAASLGLERVKSLVVCGFSQGVQAVRSALRTGQLPLADRLAVVCIDGTHASIPPEKWQLDIWRDLADQARRGERLFVATCSNNVYTARLAKPFMPTLHVLRSVEPLLTPADPPHAIHARDLHLYAYASAEIDKDAHAAQQTKVLPEILARHVRPWLALVTDPPTLRETPQAKRTPLDVALGYVGWRETGPNKGDLVRRALAGCMRDGKPLGIREGVAWCAAFVGLCDAEGGASYPWRAAVRELVEDARAAGLWREVDDHAPLPGDLVIYKRGGKDPRRGEEGHVDRVVACRDGVLDVVGGNVDDAVRLRRFRLGEEERGNEVVGWIVRGGLTADDRVRVEGAVALSLDGLARGTVGA